MRFIAFEGLDGSGKSTLMRGLESVLGDRGIDFVRTREPGGTPLGDDVRGLLLRDGRDVPVPRAEALLYQAGRAQHVDTVIKPALNAKRWVLSDRYAASSVAFQAGGRTIAGKSIEWLNQFSTAGLKPHLYVLLDLTVDASARRRAGRSRRADRFEREADDFHGRVRRAYLKMAKADPKRWLILDAGVSRPKLLDALAAELKRRKWLV